MEENEIELIDYLKVIWKRKWLIVIPTLVCIIVAGVISLLLTKVWEIDILIQPGKFIIHTEEGLLEEVTIVDSKQLTAQINQASYTNMIATELNLDLKELPRVKAENIRETNLVRVSLREKDIEKAKSILRSLFEHLKMEQDRKVDIKIKGIDAEIETVELEKLNIEEEITVSKKELYVVKQRKKEIEQEMDETKNRIELLEKKQQSILKKEKRSETESLAMLIYSNEIQQSLRYYNELKELLSSKKIEEENINLEMEMSRRKMKQIENEIKYLNERKSQIEYLKFIKEPTVSLSPVFPKKKLIILIAGILGLMIFTIFAFFLEYIDKQKARG